MWIGNRLHVVFGGDYQKEKRIHAELRSVLYKRAYKEQHNCKHLSNKQTCNRTNGNQMVTNLESVPCTEIRLEQLKALGDYPLLVIQTGADIRDK